MQSGEKGKTSLAGKFCRDTAKISWGAGWELQWRAILKQKEVRENTWELLFESSSMQKRDKKLPGFPLELPRKLIHFIKPQNLMKPKQPWLYLLFHHHPFFFSPALLTLFQTNQPKSKCFISKEPLINTAITLFPKHGDAEATGTCWEALTYTGAAAGISVGSQKDTGCYSVADLRTTGHPGLQHVHSENQGGRHLLTTTLACTNANISHGLRGITHSSLWKLLSECKWPTSHFPSQLQLLKGFVFQVSLQTPTISPPLLLFPFQNKCVQQQDFIWGRTEKQFQTKCMFKTLLRSDCQASGNQHSCLRLWY